MKVCVAQDNDKKSSIVSGIDHPVRHRFFRQPWCVCEGTALDRELGNSNSCRFLFCLHVKFGSQF